MQRTALVSTFDRLFRIVRVSTLAAPLTLTLVACDDPEIEAELAAEDALAEDAEEPALALPHAPELAAAGEAQLGPPKPLCCSIDWQNAFAPRVRISTESSEGCYVYWPFSLTARAAFTVHHTYGSPAPYQDEVGWIAPDSVYSVPLNYPSALNASYCTAQGLP